MNYQFPKKAHNNYHKAKPKSFLTTVLDLGDKVLKLAVLVLGSVSLLVYKYLTLIQNAYLREWELNTRFSISLEEFEYDILLIVLACIFTFLAISLMCYALLPKSWSFHSLFRIIIPTKVLNLFTPRFQYTHESKNRIDILIDYCMGLIVVLFVLYYGGLFFRDWGKEITQKSYKKHLAKKPDNWITFSNDPTNPVPLHYIAASSNEYAFFDPKSKEMIIVSKSKVNKISWIKEK